MWAEYFSLGSYLYSVFTMAGLLVFFNACLDNCWVLSVCYLLQCAHQHNITSVKAADPPAFVLCVINPLCGVNL